MQNFTLQYCAIPSELLIVYLSHLRVFLYYMKYYYCISLVKVLIIKTKINNILTYINIIFIDTSFNT